MSGTGSKRDYPDGDRRTATDKWRDDVLAKLAEYKAVTPRKKPWSSAGLAKMVHADKNGIRKLLLPSAHPDSHSTSAFVEPISELLGVPLPTIAGTPDDEEILTVIALLDASKKDTVLRVARELAGLPAKRPRTTK